MYDALFKVVLIGNRGVGLTAFLKSLVKFSFYDTYSLQSTGINFYTKEHSYDNYTCKISLWRISSEERFNFIRTKYCRGAHGAIILYDLTDPKSLKSIPEWIEEIIENTEFKIINEANQLKRINIPIMLLGNKVDLINSRKIFKDDVDYLLDKFKISFSHEISAKNGIDTGIAFNKLLERMVEIWIEHL